MPTCSHPFRTGTPAHRPPNERSPQLQSPPRSQRRTMRRLVSTTAGKPVMTGRKRSCTHCKPR